MRGDGGWGVAIGMTATVTGTIAKINMRRTGGKKRIMIAEATLIVGSNKVRAIWFHQPYIANQYNEGDLVTLTGKVSGAKKTYLTNPIIKRAVGDGGGGAGGNAVLGGDAVAGGGGAAVGGDAVAGGGAATGDDGAVASGDAATASDGNTATANGGGSEARKELIAVYPETQGISSLWLSSAIEKLLGTDDIKSMRDPIPEEMRTRLHLPGLYDALI